jgi:hypothetical protein
VVNKLSSTEKVTELSTESNLVSEDSAIVFCTGAKQDYLYLSLSKIVFILANHFAL